MSTGASRAGTLITQLALEPHPEGGFYRQVYRSTSLVQPADDRAPRRSLTTIYFLLERTQCSRWHRVRSDEVWHFYEGDPIELLLADPDWREITSVRLGPLDAGQRVHTVPADWWQAARPTGSYGLAGCTVAPGFEFDDFDFLRANTAGMDRLARLRPDLVALT